MAAEQKPSKDLFVVHAKRDRQTVQDALLDFGEVEEIKGGDNLLLVQLNKDSADKKTRQSIQDQLGKDEVVQPVLVDESGQHQYPTGEISVRFERNPSDAELKRFAKAHKLAMRRRNEYVPQQVIFEPLDPADRYVPEVIEEISSDKNVQLAWANTLSRYQKL